MRNYFPDRFRFFRSRLSLPVLAAALFLAQSAAAGPPLICHPFDIGNARSLPWIGHDWNLTGSENYDTRNLAADTLAILDASQSPLVHMETLRRATLYARKDPLAAKQLLVRVVGRVQNDATSAGAFAYFDAAYITEAYKQWLGEKGQNPAGNLDGVPWIEKAIQLRGNDPQMEFAAALITLRDGGAAQAGHAQKAMAGAQADPLLAGNLKSHFLSGPTMAEMIQRSQSKLVRQ
jgi:hypothetical protein